jgi:AcrR family transcriptional regulator
MEDIASRAGVGIGTVYRRFTSKDALIDELLRLALADIVSAADRASATDTASRNCCAPRASRSPTGRWQSAGDGARRPGAPVAVLPVRGRAPAKARPAASARGG